MALYTHKEHEAKKRQNINTDTAPVLKKGPARIPKKEEPKQVFEYSLLYLENPIDGNITKSYIAKIDIAGILCNEVINIRNGQVKTRKKYVMNYLNGHGFRLIKTTEV